MIQLISFQHEYQHLKQSHQRLFHVLVMVKAVRKAGRNMLRDFGEVAQLQVREKGAGDFVTP